MKHKYYVPYHESCLIGYTTSWLIVAIIVSIFKGFKPIRRFVPTPLKEDVCEKLKRGMPGTWSPITCNHECPLYERCGDSSCGY